MSHSNANAEQLEQIVAYLDGELSPEESARIERELASNEEFRQQLQGIERAWAALDELPRATVDDNFSRTTMELAVVAARQEVQDKTIALPTVRRNSWLSTALLGAAATLLGFLVVRALAPNPNRQLIAELPLITNVDLYTQLKHNSDEESEFLRLLAARELELVDDGAQEDVVAEMQEISRLETAAARKTWLSELPAAEKTTLLYKSKRFRDLSQNERERMREIHAAIARSPDSERLRATLASYGHWLTNLPQSQQFELRQMSPDQRVAEVERLVGEMRGNERLALSDKELRKLAMVIRRARPDAMRVLSDRVRRGRRQDQDHMPPGELPDRMRRQFTAGKWDELRQKVIDALPDRVRTEFEELSPSEQMTRLRDWLRQAATLMGEVSEQELESFFAEELDAETREELLKLSPEEMRQRLMRLFYRQSPRRGFDGRRFDGPRFDGLGGQTDPPPRRRVPDERRRQDFGPPPPID